MGGACGTYGGEKECILHFGKKTRRKEPLARPRRRWKDIFKMDFVEIGWEVMEWLDLAQDRVQWQVTNLQVP